jgi:radical SAM superfamily enzyme YgiQ (UPF0313 family)
MIANDPSPDHRGAVDDGARPPGRLHLTLIHPCVSRTPGRRYIRSWVMEPLAPAYLAALAPDDVSVSFHDDRIESIPYDDPTDLVAISIETYTARRAYQIATAYRRRGVPVVMGGFHATLATEEVLRYAEAVVAGEAESSFPRLLADFRAGRMQRLYQADARADLRDITPDRSIFAGKRYLPLGLVETTRGCTFQCEFCAVSSYYHATQVPRPIENVVAEVESLRQSRKLFFFVDDNFACRRAEAKRLFEALIPLKIRWVSQGSITMAYDEELLALMKRSGCQGVLIGFESLDPENLLAMNKGFNRFRGGYEEALRRLRCHGLRLYATFVFGYDRDTPESFARTVAFCRRHKFFMAAFNHLLPFPGTPLYAKLEAEGRMRWDKWWLAKDYRYGQAPFRSVLPPERLAAECLQARKRFYSLGSMLSRSFDRTNAGSLFMWQAFWIINWMLRGEASQRDGMILGDQSFEGELLPVGAEATLSGLDGANCIATCVADCE